MIKKIIEDKILLWIITIVIAAAIFYISSIPFPVGPPGTKNIAFLSTVYHLLSFFFLALFFLFALKPQKKSMFILANIILVLYVILDEIHQLFVPGRYFSLFDILCDAIGILIANLIYLRYRR